MLRSIWVVWHSLGLSAQSAARRGLTWLDDTGAVLVAGGTCWSPNILSLTSMSMALLASRVPRAAADARRNGSLKACGAASDKAAGWWEV